MPDANRFPVKLSIVDDDLAYRNSMRDLLENEDDICLYREYENGMDFIRDINSPFQPDVCLIDIRLGDISGIQCAKMVKEKKPDLAIIIMTAYPDIDTFKEARSIGADYIEKSARAESLIKKIILSSGNSKENKIFFLNDNELNPKHLELVYQLEEVKKRLDLLTESQIEILRYKKEGKTIKEISEILGVHTGTVGTQLSRIYEKLNLPQLLDYI